MQSMPKIKLSYLDLFEGVRSMMKTKQDNDLIDHKGAFYAKKNIDQVFNEN